jgi:hypothetical protein
VSWQLPGETAQKPATIVGDVAELRGRGLLHQGLNRSCPSDLSANKRTISTVPCKTRRNVSRLVLIKDWSFSDDERKICQTGHLMILDSIHITDVFGQTDAGTVS